MSTLSFMISSILEYFRIKRYIQDVVSKEAMAMKREAVEEFVSSVVEGIIAGTDMELVDVDYVVNGIGIYVSTLINQVV
mgnify:CR=1 FL=1